jgi:transposase
MVTKAQRQRFGRWAFYELATFIQYKAKLVGVPVVKVNPAYTSQTCSRCGHYERGNRNGEVFICKTCGYECNADLNASYNIAAEGKMYIQIVNVVSELIVRAAVNQPIVAIEKQNPVSIHNRMSDKPSQKLCFGDGS